MPTPLSLGGSKQPAPIMTDGDRQQCSSGFYFGVGMAFASPLMGFAWGFFNALGGAVLALAWDKFIGR